MKYELLKNINLLCETARKFVDLPRERDIYTFIGNQLQQFLIKDSYTIVSSFDSKTKLLTTREIIGIQKLSEQVTNILGRNPVGMTYNAEDKNLTCLSDDKLHLYEKGIYGLVLKTIPETICTLLQELLNVKRIFTIALTEESKLFGTIVIMLKENIYELKNKQLIEAFVNQASIAILRKLAEEAIKEDNQNLMEVVSNITIAIWKTDINENGIFENTFISPVADELLELSAGTIQNDWEKFLKYIKPRYLELVNNALRESARSSGSEIECKYEVLKDNGQTAWFQSNVRCIENIRGMHFFGYTIDITDRIKEEEVIKHQLSEKEIILQEVHHRMKNNFTCIGDLLSLQAQSIDNPKVQSALNNAVGRVNSMRILYERLLTSEKYQVISIKEYLNNLIDDLVNTLSDNLNLTIEKKLDDVHLDTKQLFPIGLIVNELITNIMKYAFTKRESCLIVVTLKESHEEITITIQDNGNGLPEGFSNAPQIGFGLKLIRMLIHQLNGSFEIYNHEGTRSVIKFGKSS